MKESHGEYMKRMTTKQKIAGCAAAALILLIVALFAVNIGYDEVGDSIRKAEKDFGIEGIDYEEVLYFRPFKGGPLGEGDSLLALQLSDESAKKIAPQLQGKLAPFPMDKEVRYFIYECRTEESEHYLDHIKNLDEGFYGFYSYTEEELIQGSDLIKAAKYATPVLSGYLYIQYDNETGTLYIWDHSG